MALQPCQTRIWIKDDDQEKMVSHIWKVVMNSQGDPDINTKATIEETHIRSAYYFKVLTVCKNIPEKYADLLLRGPN